MRSDSALATTRVVPADLAGEAVQQQRLAAEPAPSQHPSYGVQVGATHILAGGRTSWICHEVPEVVIVLTGALSIHLDEHVEPADAGCVFTIPAHSWHSFENASDAPATMLFAFGGAPEHLTQSCSWSRNSEATHR